MIMHEVKLLDGYTEENNELVSHIYDYIMKQTGNNYDAIIKSDYRPSVFDALTDCRAAEFGWYVFKKNAKVLEMNAEWGGCTGELCGKCGSVTVVERNVYKAKGISKRHEDRKNLTIYAGDWQSLPVAGIYDYVIVHDFESFFEDAVDSRTRNLGMAVKALLLFLKPDGTLLLNVANKYAAKYWCGEPRALTAPSFPSFTIEGKKFGVSKGEMETSLEELNGIRYKFYYPLFDRNKPQQVFTDYCPPKESSLKAMELYRRNKSAVFHDERTLYGMSIKEGVFPLYAGAFMVECVKGNAQLSDIEYAKISADKPRALAMSTVIMSNKVLKKPLFEEGNAHIKEMYSYYKDLQSHGIPIVKMDCRDNMIAMPLIRSERLGEHLQVLAKTDKCAFYECLDKLYDCICTSSEHVPVEASPLCSKRPEADWGPVLRRAYLELIDLNCFYDGEYLFFDQEYMRENYPAKYIMYRELINLYYAYPEIEGFVKKADAFSKFGLDEIQDILKEEEYGHFLAGLVDTEFYLRMMHPHDAYSMGQEATRQSKARREAYLFAGCADRILVVIGSGIRFKRYMDLYGKRYWPDILVDNNSAKWGEAVCGRVVCGPQKMAEAEPSKLHVIICAKDYESIEAQLLEMKIYNYRIF